MAWYRDIEHFKGVSGHEVNGVWYPRVTKIIDIKAKPGLEFFLKEMGHAADSVKIKSAEEGTLIHGVIQKIAIGEPVDIPREITPAVNRFQEFNEKRKILLHPEFIERSVWSSKNRYAGTVDALATVDDKFGVLDIKTSPAFYPEYNLQTAAYFEALREYEISKALSLPRKIETRWILRINQHKICKQCGATLREKGGRIKIKNGNNKFNGIRSCREDEHEWGEIIGDVELKEFPYYDNDVKAFLAAKTLWEWENDYWLRQIGYLK